MCGRLNVKEDPLNKLVSEALGIAFETHSNPDLRPTDRVACIAANTDTLTQVDASWGIKPAWAKQPLINAQAETVATKPTFRQAFARSRCIVPCSAWFEWKAQAGSRKKLKYSFKAIESEALYLAGILFAPPANDASPQVVVLTESPSPSYANYHHRMPVALPSSLVKDWVFSPPDTALGLIPLSQQEFEPGLCA